MNPAILPSPKLIAHPDDLARLIPGLREAGIFALDTESNSLYAYHYRVCLIQISTPENDYLIDPLSLPDLHPLKELVGSPGIEVIMHAAENDILLLHRDFDFQFNQVFDTLWGARILGWSKPGLTSILKERFGVKQDKRMQRADWGKRPLDQAQLEYARQDTHYLLSLRQIQLEELQARNRWQEAQEAFAELLQIRWEEKDAPTIWRLSGVRDLEPDQQAVLEALFNWREAKASRRDVPPFKILRNETLISLAEAQPQTEQELRQLPHISKRLPPRVARELLRAIQEGRKNPPSQPPQYNTYARPDSATQTRYDRLRTWRRTTAQRRGVESDVVLTNQVLLAIARANPASLAELAELEMMGAWKLQAYGTEVLREVRD